jgi:uncharacterized small protein (DUF1192 family)
MDISINQRLKEIIKTKEIDPPVLYKKLGVNRTTWSGWVNANKAIPVEKLVLILNELKDIDARWLLTGESAAPVKAKPYYKPDVEIDIANDGKDCCRLCKEKDERIMELKDHISTLKSQLEAKKETQDADSTQFGEGAKQRKIN